MLTRRQLLAIGACALAPACGSGLQTLTASGTQVRLTFAQFPQLAAAGGSAVVDVSGRFPIIVVRQSATAAAALSATCTHAACIVDFTQASGHVHCNCHDADFDLDGNVLRGPPPVPLPTYAATVQSDAIAVELS